MQRTLRFRKTTLETKQTGFGEITFYQEDNVGCGTDFDSETLTFTLIF